MNLFNSFGPIFSFLIYGLSLVSSSRIAIASRARIIARDFDIPELEAATSSKDLKWFNGKEAMKNYPEIFKKNLCADVLRKGVFSENRVNIAKYCMRVHLEHLDKIGDIGALRIIDLVAEAGEYHSLLDIFFKNPNICKLFSSLKFFHLDEMFNEVMRTGNIESFFAKLNEVQEDSAFHVQMYGRALYHNVPEHYYVDALASKPPLCYAAAEIAFEKYNKMPIDAEILEARLISTWEKTVQGHVMGQNAHNDIMMFNYCSAFNKLIKIAFICEDLSMSQIGMLPEDLAYPVRLAMILPFVEIFKKKQLFSEIIFHASAGTLVKTIEILFAIQITIRNDDGIKLIFQIYDQLPGEARDQVNSDQNTLMFFISHSNVFYLNLQNNPTKENPSIVIFRPNPDIVALGAPEKIVYFDIHHLSSEKIAYLFRKMKFDSEDVMVKAIENLISLTAFAPIKELVDQGVYILTNSHSIVQMASSSRLQRVILEYNLRFTFELENSEEIFRHPAVAEMTNILSLEPIQILKIAPFLNDKKLWINLETYLGRSIPDVMLSYEGDYPAEIFFDFRNIIIYGFAKYRNRLMEFRQQELNQHIALNFPELNHIFRRLRIA